jgi:hypothetical protein
MRGKLFHLHQERYSKPFLLLDIGMLHLRLHFIDAGQHPINITTLREEILIPGDMSLLLEMVRSVLDTDSDVRDLAIVMNSPAIRHQVFAIPHFGAAERHKILMHEMKHSTAGGETSGVVSHWSAGKIKDQDTTKEYVLCAEMNQSVADSLIAVVREKKFNLIGFTSHAQIVSHLLKECRVDGDLNVALLEANDREGGITLFHSGIWNMDRHFLIGGSNIPLDSQAIPGLDAEKVKLEIGRALQYFKQQVRSENINQIFLFGATNHATAIKDLLESSFRIPVTLLALEGKTFAIKDSAEKPEGSLPLYGIAHAVALHAHFDKYISFLPREWRREKHVKSRRMALIASALVFYALLGGITYFLNREASKITSREASGMQSPLLHDTTAQKNTQQLQFGRSFALATEQSDQWMRTKHRIVVKLARELAGTLPPQMRITMMELTEKGDAWQVKLQAEINSPNGSRSRQVFLSFQEQMQQMPCLKHLAWQEVQVIDSQSASPADSDDLGTRAHNLLTFTMQGMLGYTAFPAKSPSHSWEDPINGWASVSAF